jgi:hypothetical protein
MSQLDIDVQPFLIRTPLSPRPALTGIARLSRLSGEPSATEKDCQNHVERYRRPQ